LVGAADEELRVDAVRYVEHRSLRSLLKRIAGGLRRHDGKRATREQAVLVGCVFGCPFGRLAEQVVRVVDQHVGTDHLGVARVHRMEDVGDERAVAHRCEDGASSV
jgi:hypothetical protein